MYIPGNELIMKEGLIHKRRGLSRKKRHLILTDYPSLYYIGYFSDKTWVCEIINTLKSDANNILSPGTIV